MDESKKGKRPDSLDPKTKKIDTTCLKPMTVNNILYYYFPIVGTASYTLLSVSVMNPMLRFSFLTKKDLCSILLMNSVVGIGCYIHSRPHMKLTSSNSRLAFSVFGSFMFPFASVLAWAILRNFFSENLPVSSVVGIATSYVFIRGGISYLEFVDSKICK